jgi:ubiquinone/menaquinone biosynthesis C-methylase UbiE
MAIDHDAAILRYYNKRESRWGYRWLLKGVRHYGYYPAGFRFGFASAQRAMERELGRALALPEGSRVLDAGSGEGRVALLLAQEFGLQIFGVDLVEHSVLEAQRLAAQHPDAQIHFERGDYNRLPFPDSSFAGAFTMETLVHASDPAHALGELARVMHPGGHLALFEYTIAPLRSMSSHDRAIWDDIVAGAAMPALAQFTHASFPELLASAGFDDIRVQDFTTAVLPMLRQLSWIATPVYLLMRSSTKRRRLVNVTAGATMYYQAAVRDNWRYVKVTARRGLDR